MIETVATRDEVLRCTNVWKMFGPDAHRVESGAMRGLTAEQMEADGRHVAAVKDVTLSVRRGEILVLMGLSGSGKSTLLRCMTRLVKSTYGSIGFDGLDLAELNTRRLMQVRREKMGDTTQILW